MTNVKATRAQIAALAQMAHTDHLWLLSNSPSSELCVAEPDEAQPDEVIPIAIIHTDGSWEDWS